MSVFIVLFCFLVNHFVFVFVSREKPWRHNLPFINISRKWLQSNKLWRLQNQILQPHSAFDNIIRRAEEEPVTSQILEGCRPTKVLYDCCHFVWHERRGVTAPADSRLKVAFTQAATVHGTAPSLWQLNDRRLEWSKRSRLELFDSKQQGVELKNK